MSKTIIVSNRLPVKISEHEGELSYSSSEGGLATGLGSIYRSGDNLWIGWPGLEITDPTLQAGVKEKLTELSLAPVFLSHKEILHYYEGFSNEVLWPIFHYYASTYAYYKETNWEYYKLVNEKFCEAVLEKCEPGDTVWIHDYQLLLLPALIRNRLPDVLIGFFLHIPFPSFELFRLIPWRSELLDGIVGADLVGFHTFEDARHFISSASRLLPCKTTNNVISYLERSIVIEAFPMGIDSTRYANLTAEENVKREVAYLRDHFDEVKMLLSIDRLDYSKGILQRLAAFELLLETHPEYVGSIALYMIVVPSRDTVQQYKDLRDQIDKRVGNINSRYSTMIWSPVHYFYRSFPVETLSALYQFAPVCLVTPMRDGMNLVSKEYVASRINEDGVLILSELAGASKELVDALIINPGNTKDFADAIHTALSMSPADQQRHMKALREVVFKFTVKHWVRIYMERLGEVKLMQDSMKARRLGPAGEEEMFRAAGAAGKRLLLLDYDGTLVGFQGDIQRASPDAQLYDLLETLSHDPVNRVVIISGRKHEDLEAWFAGRNLSLVAEHGSWTKNVGGEWQKIPGLNASWKAEVKPIFELYADRTPGSFIEEKSYSLVWHYRKVERELGDLRAGELLNNIRFQAADLGLQLLPGDKIIEVKNAEINKGKAALKILDEHEYLFVLAIGDDYTDEDIFKALPKSAFTVKVGGNISAATWYVRNYSDVRRLLGAFADRTNRINRLYSLP